MNTPKSRPDSDPTLDELVRQNPVYRDTPLGQGEVELMPRRLRSPANFGRPRKLLWKWLGLPEPRAIVRALMIDGYPKDIRRWAYERMETGIHWISFVGGMAVAALVAWFAAKLDFSSAGIMLTVFAAAILPGFLAITRLLPIFNALRYARRWRRNSGPLR